MADNHTKHDPHNSTMSLGDHLEELRLRVILAVIGLVLAVILCMCFGTLIIKFIEGPYIKAMGKQARLQSLAPADGFTSYMTISGVAGLVISAPWIFYQLWMFISAGLYPTEKRYVYAAAPFSAGLFIIGALFFVFVIAPVTLQFLVMFNREVLGVDSNFTFQNYVSFIAVMMLIFGLAFQTPLAIYFLNKIGLVSVRSFRSARRFVMLGIVVLAAVATPGSDMFSLFSLAIPLYMLYELGIILCNFSVRKKKSADGE